MPKALDPMWVYGEPMQLPNRQVLTCNLCGKKIFAGISRLKYHLAKILGFDVDACPNSTSKIMRIANQSLIDMANKRDTEAEEEIGLPVDPMPPPPPWRAIPRVGLGSVGTGRRQHTFPSTLSPSLTTSDGASEAAGASTPSSSRVPPRPPTASRGKLVPFTRKRARAARPRGNQ
jgi:hypothetical protein